MYRCSTSKESSFVLQKQYILLSKEKKGMEPIVISPIQEKMPLSSSLNLSIYFKSINGLLIDSYRLIGLRLAVRVPAYCTAGHGFKSVNALLAHNESCVS